MFLSSFFCCLLRFSSSLTPRPVQSCSRLGFTDPAFNNFNQKFPRSKKFSTPMGVPKTAECPAHHPSTHCRLFWMQATMERIQNRATFAAFVGRRERALRLRDLRERATSLASKVRNQTLWRCWRSWTARLQASRALKQKLTAPLARLKYKVRTCPGQLFFQPTPSGKGGFQGELDRGISQLPG